jgi:hypothetical protein
MNRLGHNCFVTAKMIVHPARFPLFTFSIGEKRMVNKQKVATRFDRNILASTEKEACPPNWQKCLSLHVQIGYRQEML